MAPKATPLTETPKPLKTYPTHHPSVRLRGDPQSTSLAPLNLKPCSNRKMQPKTVFNIEPTGMLHTPSHGDER